MHSTINKMVSDLLSLVDDDNVVHVYAVIQGIKQSRKEYICSLHDQSTLATEWDRENWENAISSVKTHYMPRWMDIWHGSGCERYIFWRP